MAITVRKGLFSKARGYIAAFIVGSMVFAASPDAHAKTSHHVIVSRGVDRYASLVVNAETGEVLHQENADKYRYPASLTKMMTLYLTFEALQTQRLSMDQQLPVSAFAASRPRMNMGLRKGQTISVRDAIMALIVRSANDVAVVLAEAIGRSEPEFASMMTNRAHSLGMTHTVFRNASGLPNNEQKTTAYDLARLAIALRRDFPEYYSLFARTNFTFRGRMYEGHNRITRYYPGADGLKTGFVNASGFNLVSSAKRGNTKLIGVVMGGETAGLRDRKMMTLLDYYFSKSGETPVHMASVPVKVAQDAGDRPIQKVLAKKHKKVHVAAKKGSGKKYAANNRKYAKAKRERNAKNYGMLKAQKTASIRDGRFALSSTR